MSTDRLPDEDDGGPGLDALLAGDDGADDGGGDAEAEYWREDAARVNALADHARALGYAGATSFEAPPLNEDGGMEGDDGPFEDNDEDDDEDGDEGDGETPALAAELLEELGVTAEDLDDDEPAGGPIPPEPTGNAVPPPTAPDLTLDELMDGWDG